MDSDDVEFNITGTSFVENISIESAAVFSNSFKVPQGS